MDRAAEMRKGINALDPDLKISINDIIIKVAAAALIQHPEVNASFQEKFVRYYEHADIGVAVAIEDGLITPVVRSADQKSLSQIATEVRELAERARSRKLKPEEYTGASFSISNLGMFGIDEFTAVINPPEGAILAVGAMTAKPVVRDNEIVIRQMMRVTMSCDHRVIDGATGAKFLQTFKKILENPLYLVVLINTDDTAQRAPLRNRSSSRADSGPGSFRHLAHLRQDRSAIDVSVESRGVPAHRRRPGVCFTTTQTRATFRMPVKDLAVLALCSMLGIVGNQLLFVKGLSLTTVINATLLSTTIPVFTLFVSILFGYDRMSLRRLLGIALAAGGVAYLVNPAQADLSTQTTAGNLLIVSNSLLYAVYIVLSKDLFERYGALNVITWIFLVSCVVMVPVGIFSLQRENLGEISSRRVADTRVDCSASDSGRLLPECVGTDKGRAEHSRNLHLPATVNCVWFCAAIAG